MNTKTLLLSLTVTFSAVATANTTRILHIDAPETIDAPYEVLTSASREVIEVDANNIELVEKLQIAKEDNSPVNLHFNDKSLTDLDLLQDNEPEEIAQEELHPMLNYTPTDVETVDAATELFNSLNDRTKWFSQCFNRAHIWAKSIYDKFEVSSMKILIYYTKKYRREIDKKWWFHIAPMVQVGDERYVLDREFTRKPFTDENWEKIFTKKMEAKGIYGHRCKVIKNIKEFYDQENQETEYCNIQVTSMYYWEPNDMSRLDKKGTQKTQFINWELRAAAKEAFKKWRQVYKEVKVQNL